MKSWTEVCILLSRLRGEITVREYIQRIARLRGESYRCYSWRSAQMIVIRA